MKTRTTKINQKHADIINKHLKGDLNRDFDNEKRKYNTLYIQTTIDCMRELERLHQKDIELKPTQEQILSAIIKQVSYLLTDWSSNIKEFNIVHNDILDRMKRNAQIYIDKDFLTPTKTD